MTTQTAAYSGSNSGGGFIGKLLIVVFVALGVFTLLAIADGLNDPDSPAGWTTFEPVDLGPVVVVVDPAYSHADEKHPTEALAVRECLNRKGAYQSFMISREMKRFLRVCITDNGQFGFQIVDQVGREFREVTAYLRHELKNVNDLVKYVDRVGYSRFKGVIK